LSWSTEDSHIQYINSCIVFSFSTNVSCPSSRLAIFTFFFLVPSASHCMIFICWMRAIERQSALVRVSAVVYLHNCHCSFLCAMCSYSFCHWKMREEREKKEKIKMQNDTESSCWFFCFLMRLYVLIFFHEEISHLYDIDIKSSLLLWINRVEENNDDLFIYLRIERYECLFLTRHSLQKKQRRIRRDEK
jgi:hypothetical protein